MPPLDHMDHLAAFFQEVGPAASGGMGLMPISFTEIYNWASVTGTTLTGWEAKTLRQMSKAYVAEYNRSDDEHTPPPYEDREFDRDEVGQKVIEAFNFLGARRGNNTSRKTRH